MTLGEMYHDVHVHVYMYYMYDCVSNGLSFRGDHIAYARVAAGHVQALCVTSSMSTGLPLSIFLAKPTVIVSILLQVKET